MIRGRIVLVLFPFDDLSSAKVRPAVCLTEPVGLHRHVILAFITSRVPDDLLDSDIVLESDSYDFAMTGLRMTSTLRLHRMITLSTSLIRRDLGKLPPRVEREVASKLKKMFGLM